MTHLKCILFLFLFWFGSDCRCQNFSFPSLRVPQVLFNNLPKAKYSINLQEFVSIEDFLPEGYSKKGDIDYTTHIQSVINENKKVRFPNFPILISDEGLIIPSNREIFFDTNSWIKMSPSNKTNYSILNIEEVDNVVLYEPKIEGDRRKHLSKGGEWGMGVSILGATNVKIYNIRVRECWGDGVYIGVKDKGSKQFSDDVLIEGGGLITIEEMVYLSLVQ